MARKSFLSGAIILMAAGFIVRLLGFVYRIYLSNLIGAEGMGLFQLISPVYSFVILSLTSGISIAVSKMTAEHAARSQFGNVARITRCALAMVLAAGIMVSLPMLIGIDSIVDVILKDRRTYYSMLLFIPSIPAVAAASALKGYFYGMQDVAPTALSQVAEQVVRIGVVIAVTRYSGGMELEYACALATVGMVLGEVSNFAVLYVIYRFKRRKRPAAARAKLLPKRTAIKGLLHISLPVSINRSVTSMMSAMEMILIPRRLLAGGLGYKQSIEEYGKLTGMAMPLLYFPSLVASSLATTLVPAISEAISLRNFRSANYRISKSIQITFILGFTVGALFLSYPGEIGRMIYPKEDIGYMLFMLSFGCVFIYLQQVLIGILNGLGKQGGLLIDSIVGYGIRIGFVYFLVPLYGIKGYVWGTIASMVIACGLNLWLIIKTTGMTVDIRGWIVKPGLVALAVFSLSRYMYELVGLLNVGPRLVTVMAVALNIVLALVLTLAAGVLSVEELIRLLGINRKKR